jgi:hypothetical protein
MTGPERIEWRRSFPAHALVVLGWYVVIVGLCLGVVWLLFGTEPAELDTGSANPLAVVMPVSLVLAGLGVLPFIVAVLRRPVVVADHYALQVRPTWLRTLVVPWVRISEIAAYRVDEEPYLLVRCRNALDRLGDRPSWVERSVLRTVLRSVDSDVLDEYHLAVRMRDFTGTPQEQLDELAPLVPAHVTLVNEVRSA